MFWKEEDKPETGLLTASIWAPGCLERNLPENFLEKLAALISKIQVGIVLLS